MKQAVLLAAALAMCNGCCDHRMVRIAKQAANIEVTCEAQQQGANVEMTAAANLRAAQTILKLTGYTVDKGAGHDR